MSIPHDREALLEAIRAGQRFDYLTFWGHRRERDHGVDASCPSQWSPASYVVGGVGHRTAEHWKMAEKARLFGDHDAWAARRYEAVVEGNEAKFAQNEAMGRFLVATGDRVLVEASTRRVR